METLLQVATSWILPAFFFWFIFSFIATIIIEFISTVIKSRQKGLENVLELLMGSQLKDDLYAHELVNPLRNNKERSNPAYISKYLFAKVIMDWILVKIDFDSLDMPNTNKFVLKNIEALAKKDAGFGKTLTTITIQARLKTTDIPAYLKQIQDDLEYWFEEAANQKSSSYRMSMQYVVYLVSIFVAAITNFDPINMTTRLWETSKYNELISLIEKAETIKKLFENEIDISLFTTLPLGWYSINTPSTILGWTIKVIGICLGGVFIAIGSQYVHEFLQNKMNGKEEKEEK